jgi:integrase
VKRSAIKRRPLADSVLSALDLDAKDYRERDSAGLYFRVQKNGSKSWLLRYKRPCGTWAWKGLGGYPGVSGKLAREKARDLLNHSSGGKDLVHMSSCVQEKMTFKEAAEDWYDRKVKAGRVAGSLKQYGLYLNKDIYPAIGHKALDAVTRLDCAAIQSKMEARGAGAIAGKVRLWINQIFSLAMAQGHCTVNPASELRYLAQQGHQETPHPHLLEDELPAFLMALRKSTSKQITLIMTRLVLRTACRPGMARFSEWVDMDLDNSLWTIPAAKMKMRRDHIIPLSPQTVAELRTMHETSGVGRYVFPGFGPKNPTMSENTINKCLRLVGYKGKLVGHGARHTASTLLREHRWDKDYVEMQLAHVEGGDAGVYNQAQYLDKRREMMCWYSDYLDYLETGKGKGKGKRPMHLLTE